jgi:hypothetical protein
MACDHDLLVTVLRPGISPFFAPCFSVAFWRSQVPGPRDTFH